MRITHSLQLRVWTKSSISQLECISIFIIYADQQKVHNMDEQSTWNTNNAWSQAWCLNEGNKWYPLGHNIALRPQRTTPGQASMYGSSQHLRGYSITVGVYFIALHLELRCGHLVCIVYINSPTGSFVLNMFIVRQQGPTLVSQT